MENCVSSTALDAARTRLDAAEAARETILLQHIANGVIIDSRTVQIAPDVQIAPGAVILAGTILRGHTCTRPPATGITTARTCSPPWRWRARAMFCAR